jgi:hypothetical protein
MKHPCKSEIDRVQEYARRFYNASPREVATVTGVPIDLVRELLADRVPRRKPKPKPKLKGRCIECRTKTPGAITLDGKRLYLCPACAVSLKAAGLL